MKKKVHDFEKSNLAYKNSIGALKEEVKKLKEEKTKLDKKMKQVAKKVKSDKLENKTDSNQNIPPDFSSRSFSSELSPSRTQASSTPTLGPRPPRSTSPPNTPA